jgi:hypothetical protein
MQETTNIKANPLGQEITKRLAQLGMSRREFSRRNKLSRQTLHSLEHSYNKGFAPSTFDAVDVGLKWPSGTAKAFYEGIANAKDLLGGSTTEELIREYLSSILGHVCQMNLEELEREVLMLEEETFGRPLPTSEESLNVIRETVNRLTNAMLNGIKEPPVHNGGRKVKDVGK